LAPGLCKDDLIAHGLYEAGPNVKLIAEERYELMACCDVVMAASGTVTLELAILNVPMVVAYRLSPLTYLIGRLLVKVPFFSLVNLVAGRKVVTELLQKDASPERISRELQRLLDDPEAYTTMKNELKLVSRQLGEPGASNRTAQLALELVDAR
jgi:lipid-A-disaccharide synthase